MERYHQNFFSLSQNYFSGFSRDYYTSKNCLRNSNLLIAPVLDLNQQAIPNNPCYHKVTVPFEGPIKLGKGKEVGVGLAGGTWLFIMRS